MTIGDRGLTDRAVGTRLAARTQGARRRPRRADATLGRARARAAAGRLASCGPRAAFTLLELIVVLSLIVVLTGVIVPRMGRSIGSRELREAAGRFALTARTVRELAVARQRVCAIEIDLDRGGYGVATQSSEDRPGQWQTLQASWLKPQRWPATISVVSYRTPDGSTAASGRQYLKFFPDGTSSGAALRLAGREDEYDVVVHPHSGRVVYGDRKTATFATDTYDLGD